METQVKEQKKWMYRPIEQSDLEDFGEKYFRMHPGYGKDPMLPSCWNEFADEYLMTDELAGEKANPFVVYCHKHTSLSSRSARSDETAWCASYMNTALIRTGFRGSAGGVYGKTSAAATSLGEVGAEQKELREGAILVIKHLTGSLAGHFHTTMFVRRSSSNPNIIYCRGGNQGNTVCIQAYDLRKEKIVHIRHDFIPLEAPKAA